MPRDAVTNHARAHASGSTGRRPRAGRVVVGGLWLAGAVAGLASSTAASALVVFVTVIAVAALVVASWRRFVTVDVVVGFAIALVIPTLVITHHPGFPSVTDTGGGRGGVRECVRDGIVAVTVIEVGSLSSNICGGGPPGDPVPGDYTLVKVGGHWFRYDAFVNDDIGLGPLTPGDALVADAVRSSWHVPPAWYGVTAAALLTLTWPGLSRRRRPKRHQRRPPTVAPVTVDPPDEGDASPDTVWDDIVASLALRERVLPDDRMDAALADIAAQSHATPLELVVNDAGGGIEVCTRRPVELKKPWVRQGDPRVWSLPADAVLTRVDVGAPVVYPGLVSVGWDSESGDEVHVDLFTAGGACLDGPLSDVDAFGSDIATMLKRRGRDLDPVVVTVDLDVDGLGAVCIGLGDATRWLTNMVNADRPVVVVAGGRAATADASTVDAFRAVADARPGVVVVGPPPIGGGVRFVADSEGCWASEAWRMRLRPLLAGDDDHDDDAVPDEILAVDVAWVEPDWAVMVRLLGDPDAIGRNGAAAPWARLERVNVRRARALEILAWAATHRGGSRDALVEAVWQGAASQSTIDNNLWAARRVCGELAGRDVEWLSVSNGQVRPDRGLIVDIDVVEAVVAWDATVNDDQVARDVLQRVAGLVTGAPGDGKARWRWFDLDGIEARASDAVVALSVAWARRCLAVDDAEGAVAATEAGFGVDPGSDDVVLARLRAQAACGDLAGVDDTQRRYLRRCASLERHPDERVTALIKELAPTLTDPVMAGAVMAGLVASRAGRGKDASRSRGTR